jgi:hypothetical protein
VVPPLGINITRSGQGETANQPDFGWIPQYASNKLQQRVWTPKMKRIKMGEDSDINIT